VELWPFYVKLSSLYVELLLPISGDEAKENTSSGVGRETLGRV